MTHSEFRCLNVGDNVRITRALFGVPTGTTGAVQHRYWRGAVYGVAIDCLRPPKGKKVYEREINLWDADPLEKLF